MSSNNNHHTGHDACASGILRNTMKTFPIAIPPTPQAAPSRAAGLILRAVESLQPLTKPRRGRPCSSATAVANVLQEYIEMLTTLQVVPTPAPEPSMAGFTCCCFQDRCCRDSGRVVDIPIATKRKFKFFLTQLFCASVSAYYYT